MEVLGLTIFVSLLLALGFVLFFIHQQKDPARDDLRDSLLPFADSPGGKSQTPHEHDPQPHH